MDSSRLVSIAQAVLTNSLYSNKETLHLLQQDDEVTTLFCQDTQKDILTGYMRQDNKVVSFIRNDRQNSRYAVIADLTTKQMRVLQYSTNEEGTCELSVDIDSTNSDLVTHNRIIDLNRAGRRWEGDSLSNDQPFGFGVFYDESNNVEAECFVFQGDHVCYGKDSKW